MNRYSFLNLFLAAGMVSAVGAQPAEEIHPEPATADTITEVIEDYSSTPEPAVQGTPYQQPVETIGGYRSSSRQVNDRTAWEFRDARNQATRGAATFFVGMGLDLGVAVPLSIAAAIDMNLGLLFTSLGISMLAGALEISGPIRNGAGASLAYDAARAQGLPLSRNTNWGVYRAGWVFYAIGSGLGLIGGFSEDAALPLSFAQLGCSIAAQALWITAVANSLHYTRQAMEESGLSSIEVYPTITMNGATGLACAIRF